MALETLLIKVKTAIFSSPSSPAAPRPMNHHSTAAVGVLAFEVAGIMSKLVQLWQFLSDDNMNRLRREAIALEGVRKIISNDEAFLLALAAAETVHNLRFLADSVSRICRRSRSGGRYSSSSAAAALRSFDRFFREFADSGRDSHGWSMTWKEMDFKAVKKMERFVAATAGLYREIDELSALENSLRKLLQCCSDQSKNISDLQQRIVWQRQEVKYLKDKSLWNRSFDSVGSLLARSIFTILARTKLVFGLIGGGSAVPPLLPRSLSTSAAVHPSDSAVAAACEFVSGPLTKKERREEEEEEEEEEGEDFFEANTKMLKPPPETTVGAAALAVHYANLIIVMEKMIKSPQMVGGDARDDVYAMLPSSVRAALRARLRGVGFSATDPALASEWRAALARILAWLAPLAHNMIKWQNERSLEQHGGGGGGVDGAAAGKTNVLLLQTLYFANRDKTEAAITELLVGLNYIWRFEREIAAKSLLFECNTVNNSNNTNNYNKNHSDDDDDDDDYNSDYHNNGLMSLNQDYC